MNQWHDDKTIIVRKFYTFLFNIVNIDCKHVTNIVFAEYFRYNNSEEQGESKNGFDSINFLPVKKISEALISL